MTTLQADRAAVAARPRAGVLGVGTAVPPGSCTQREIRSIFMQSAIERRFLHLPPESADGGRVMETQGELFAKHKANGIEMGARAVQDCLKRVGAEPPDIRFPVCVTSTGFLIPGFSAHLIKELGLRPDTSCLDVIVKLGGFSR